MSGDYDVGYGKPPQHTRFRKGQSGNPTGRPKGARNLKTELLEELQEQILVREGGPGRYQGGLRHSRHHLSLVPCGRRRGCGNADPGRRLSHP